MEDKSNHSHIYRCKEKKLEETNFLKQTKLKYIRLTVIHSISYINNFVTSNYSKFKI